MTDDALGMPGGPAFPISISGYGDNGCPGMSLRDWFAGQAIATMINKSSDRHGGWDETAVAAGCYAVADAMLKERAHDAAQAERAADGKLWERYKGEPYDHVAEQVAREALTLLGSTPKSAGRITLTTSHELLQKIAIDIGIVASAIIKRSTATAAPPRPAMSEEEVVEECAQAACEQGGSGNYWEPKNGKPGLGPHNKEVCRAEARAVINRYRQLAPAGLDRERVRAGMGIAIEAARNPDDWSGPVRQQAKQALLDFGYPDLAALLDEQKDER